MTRTGPIPPESLISDPLTWTFVVVVVAATALLLIAVRGTQSLAVRCGALAIAVLLFGGAYGGLTELMSRPKPAGLEWARTQARGAQVAGSLLRENQAIYLWLVFDGGTEPRAYRLPWNEKMAQQLRRAQQEAARRHTGVRMRTPFRSKNMTGADSRRVFYAPARAPLPPKAADAS